MRRILILGSDSYIGKNLFKYLKQKKLTILGTSRSSKNRNILYLDLNNPQKSLNKLEGFQIVIFLAGITNMRYCENNKKESKLINYSNTLKLIKFFIKQKTFIIFLSTSSIFDGRTHLNSVNSKPNPLNYYAKLKYKIEKYLFERYDNYCVVRITKIIDRNSPFIKNLKKDLKKNQNIYGYKNIFVANLNVNTVINKIYFIIRNNFKGLFHLSGNKTRSYFDIIKYYLKTNKIIAINKKTDKFIKKYDCLINSATKKI